MPPWFDAGLPFTCTQCGNCCTGPGYVWISDDEVRALAEFLGDSVPIVEAVYTKQLPSGRRILRDNADGDCIFYDRSVGCKIYPVRPIQCQTWPFWERNVASPETWAETQKKCPGSRAGELISVEEILSRVKKIRL